MPSINPAQARDLIEARPGTNGIYKKDGTHRKYAFRFKFNNSIERHISIATKDSSDEKSKAPTDGVTVYINATSTNLVRFPIAEVEHHLPGVMFKKLYPKGSKGKTGDKGLSSATANCKSLDPIENDVIRVSVADAAAFKRLIAWYASEAA